MGRQPSLGFHEVLRAGPGRRANFWADLHVSVAASSTGAAALVWSVQGSLRHQMMAQIDLPPVRSEQTEARRGLWAA